MAGTAPQGRNWSAGLPASGAWTPADDPGDRQFAEFFTDRPMVLEGGGLLDGVTVAYETWGELSASGDNAILLCHALTGDAHAATGPRSIKGDEGWWQDFVGPGKALDTDRYFVVCSNVLGGCQGTTGPASINPATGVPYGPDFPTVTIRDMVRAQSKLGRFLGVDTWLAVVGGSMGGMQALEWGIMYPDRVRSVSAYCTTLAASAWQIGLSGVGRVAITLDSKWNGGRYYDAAPGEGPHAGLATARSIAQLSYKSDALFGQRFGRTPVDPTSMLGMWDRFEIESYLDYHGEKLTRRFDANSYITVNKAMDLHDVGRNRGGAKAAMRRLSAPMFTASISSDALYHPYQQQEIHDLVVAGGGHCEYEIIESDQGHDGFLVESDKVGPLMGDFIRRVEKGMLD